MKEFETVRINLLPLTEKSFRLDDDLYLADSMSTLQGISFHVTLKIEICVVLFCCKGRIHIRVNQKNLEISDNQSLLVSPGSILERIELVQGTEVIMIAFDRDRIPYALHGSSTSDIIEQTYRMPDAVYSMSAERMEIFKQYYCMTRKLLSLDASKKVQKNIIQGFSYVVMGIVDGWGSAERDSIYKANAREERLVTSFLSDIRKFALQQREVSFYAGRAELAPKYFSRLIIKITGKRPLEHIHEYLVLEAKCLLASHELTIRQIAQTLGFSNTSAFTRFFHMVAGLTPAEYAASVK